MLFRYLAYTTDRETVEGRVEAASDAMAEATLYERGLYRVVSLKEIKPKPAVEDLLPSIFAVKPHEVIEFLQQLATLLESGIAIYTALNLLKSQTSGRAMKKVIAGLSDEIREGSSFSQAMAGYPDVFAHTYCQAIKASEQSGNLEFSLKQVAMHIEKEQNTRRKVGRAFIYPSLILLMAIGVTVLLMTVVLPPMMDLYEALDIDLPWTTAWLIAISNFFTGHGLTLLVVAAALALALTVYLRTPAGRLTFNRLALKIPLIGPLNVQRHMFQFCQTASMLLRAGVLLPRVLDTLIQTSGNVIIRQALRDVREKLIQGEGLSKPLSENDVFPRLLTEMVGIGEITGTLDGSLSTLTEYYEQRVDQQIRSLVAMMEPLMTFGVGLLVVFIALATVMPLYSVMGSFS